MVKILNGTNDMIEDIEYQLMYKEEELLQDVDIINDCIIDIIRFQPHRESFKMDESISYVIDRILNIINNFYNDAEYSEYNIYGDVLEMDNYDKTSIEQAIINRLNRYI